MGLLRVDPGAGLAATVAALQLRAICPFASVAERTQQLPDPAVGTISLIGTSFEYWTGTAWARFPP